MQRGFEIMMSVVRVDLRRWPFSIEKIFRDCLCDPDENFQRACDIDWLFNNPRPRPSDRGGLFAAGAMPFATLCARIVW